MKWASGLSRNTSFEAAVSECIEAVSSGLSNEEGISLVMAFVTPHFAAHFDRIPDLIEESLSPDCFIGCSGGGVLGAGREVEDAPAVSLIGASLPGVSVTPFRIEGAKKLPDLDGPPDDWQRLIGVEPDEDPSLVILSDPFSSPTESLLSGLDYAYPGSPKVGGLVSGGPSPGTNRLFLGKEVHSGGSVGVALSGNILMETVVAQGCRPIGDLFTVTACEANYLHELDGEPALGIVRQMFSELEERDFALARSALFVGVLMDEFTEDPGPGDFLVRNVIGFDPQQGTLAVGERLQPGMRLRFHVRDARTSAEDLRLLLGDYARGTNSKTPEGALLFSCLGRGINLYREPDFDSSQLAEEVGPVPVGGFFCNGEIGPVGSSTFLHGYTSSFAFFRPKDRT